MSKSNTLDRILQKPKALSRKTWRETLRNRVGPGGERLWEVMLEIAEGRAWKPVWRDESGVEHVGEPIAPTTADRLSAARELAHMLYGKPVPQTEASRAEEDARQLEDVRALTDAELEARVKRALAIDPGPEELQEVTASDKIHYVNSPGQLGGGAAQPPENSIDSTHPGTK